MSIRHQRLITESNSNIAKPLQHKAMENISLAPPPPQKKKKKFFKIVVEPSKQTMHIKRGDLH